ncbi:MAG: sialate O-acetylesterase [Allomuricauda sp.]
MKNYIGVVLMAMFLLPSKSVNAQRKETIRLFYLGGQSNMVGYGYNADLPDTLKKFKNVWIFDGNPAPDEDNHGGLGIWTPLGPGFGTGFSSDGTTNTLSNRFGLELSFAKKMSELYPNEKIALIKYSRGGTSIDSLGAREFGSWDVDYKGTNGINQYDHFLSTVKNAMGVKDIDNNGVEDILIPSGILWMQGESDGSFSEEMANGYYGNLKRLMGLVRAAFRNDNIPIVIGKISDSYHNQGNKVWEFGELVQYAQEKFVKTDKKAAIVRSTQYYGYSDMYHYDSAGYIDLGERFAQEIFTLNK